MFSPTNICLSSSPNAAAEAIAGTGFRSALMARPPYPWRCYGSSAHGRHLSDLLRPRSGGDQALHARARLDRRYHAGLCAHRRRSALPPQARPAVEVGIVKIALGQFGSGPEKQQNLARMSKLVETAAASGADLVLFPEAAMVGGTPDQSLVPFAEPLDGQFV